MKAEENRAVSAVPQDSPRKWPRKIVKIVGNILFFLFMILVALLLFFLVQSRATGRAPEIAGHYVLVVLSGSMFPRFNTGSAAFVKPVDAAEIKQGDIITFKGFAGSDLFTTHRVIGIKQSANGPVFTTKGDANHAKDPDPVPGKDLIGRVSFTVPCLGYFINFSQTKYGLLFFIIVPGLLLVFSECRNLYKNSSKSKSKPDTPAQAAGKE